MSHGYHRSLILFPAFIHCGVPSRPWAFPGTYDNQLSDTSFFSFPFPFYLPFLTLLHRRDITFLYRLEDGVCSQSFGMHVARMAGMCDEVRSTLDT